MQQYTLNEFQSIAPPDEWECPSCSEYTDTLYRAIAQHHRYCEDDDIHFLAAYFGKRLKRAYERGRSRNELADLVGVDGNTMNDALDDLGVTWRTATEAAAAWRQDMDEETREAVLYGGQEKAAEKLAEWREENPDHHKSNAVENLPEVTFGPDHHSWRGGDGLRDMLTKIYGDEPWRTGTRPRMREEYSYQCYMCGDEHAPDNVLTVHHIVPVLSGGTNHDDNLMALCRSCHLKAEYYTRYEIGMDPVFVDD